MITNKNLLAAVAIILCCFTVIWFSTTTKGSPTTYEVRPRISLPEYKTDTVHAIDAYEKLMDRYMNQVERNSIRIDLDLKEVIKRLDSINYKLTELSLRIAKIEKKFKNPMTEEEIFDCLDKFKYIVPQGSPMFGIGNEYQNISLSNCFVTKVVDSYGGICRADERLAQIANVEEELD